MYGVVRFAEAAKELGVRTVFGAELSLGLTEPQNGVADPEGRHLLLLATGATGYGRLCRAITTGQLADGSEKGHPIYDLARSSRRRRASAWCSPAAARARCARHCCATARPRRSTELTTLVEQFGRDRVYVELVDHGLPLDTTHNDLLATMAMDLHLPVIATNAVHYADPGRGDLAAAMAAVRARRSVEELDGWLPPAPTAFLRSGAEMARRFARYPGAVQRAADLGRELSFDLTLVAPNLPPFEMAGHTEDSYLREKTYAGARERYGTPESNPAAYAQLEHELRVIEKLGFPGYFLIVSDIVDFCRRNGIYCQGRGSAANSAVCYALGITKVDAVRWKLLFERFLAPARDGPPDIDLDIESDRREEAIQYVYERYDRRHAAQVANVISYRAKSAVRDMAKALGYSPGQQDAWSKQIDRWGPLMSTVDENHHDVPSAVLELARQLENFPRHLGIHSGGMVICDRPVSEVCPVERARMDKRTVLQWDKDDCAAAGLVKFDLLGLGMLSALRYMVELVDEHHGTTVDIDDLDLDDEHVYEMLQRADSVGVFQVESRAQMATLPRLKPKEFYDLVVEVALIRPGPIQGGSVHPYIRRANGQEEITYDHPLLEKALRKTKGVPLFQEQLMQIAVDVADFTPAEADELRRAMGAKRSTQRMERLRERFYAGAARHGVDDRAGRADLREADGVRQLRLPGEPRAELRVPGVRERVVQAVLPGRVLRGAAACAADGLLLAAVVGGRRPSAPRDRPRPGPEREPRAGHPGTPQRRAAPPRPGRPCRRRGPGGPHGPGRSAADRRRTRRTDRRRTRRARPVHVDDRPGAARAADPPADRVAVHGRRVRLLRPRPPRSPVGRGRGGG